MSNTLIHQRNLGIRRLLTRLLFHYTSLTLSPAKYEEAIKSESQIIHSCMLTYSSHTLTSQNKIKKQHTTVGGSESRDPLYEATMWSPGVINHPSHIAAPCQRRCDKHGDSNTMHLTRWQVPRSISRYQWWGFQTDSCNYWSWLKVGHLSPSKPPWKRIKNINIYINALRNSPLSRSYK